MIVLPLGALGVPSSPPLLLLVLFLFFLWAPRFPLNSSSPVLASTSPPRSKMYQYNKTNDFAKPSVCQKCPLRTPLGPPRLPQGPPRAPQGRTRAPQGVPQEPLGEPGAPQGPPQRPPSTPQESPKATQRNPRSLWEGLGPAKGTPRSPGAPPSTQGNKRQPNKPAKRIQSMSFRAASDGTRLEHETEKSKQH